MKIRKKSSRFWNWMNTSHGEHKEVIANYGIGKGSVEFGDVPNKTPLEKIIKQTNKLIRKELEIHGLSLNQTNLTPGAVFVLAKIDQNIIKIIQLSDCFSFWSSHNQKAEISKNRFFLYEKEYLEKITELIKKHKGNREKMKKEFAPFIAEKRLHWINKPGGYGILNGQNKVERFLEKTSLPINEIKFLLLFTDGFISSSDTKNELNLVKKILKLYKQRRLNGILKETRKRKKERKHESYYIKYDEATAIAIEF